MDLQIHLIHFFTNIRKQKLLVTIIIILIQKTQKLSHLLSMLHHIILCDCIFTLFCTLSDYV